MWIDYLENKEPLGKTYDSLLLNPLKILRVLLDEKNVTLKIYADLPEFPENAPKKWIEKEANTVQIELEFLFCKHIVVRNFSTENVADLRVEKDESGKLSFNLKGSDNFQLSGTCNFIYLQAISAYQNEK